MFPDKLYQKNHIQNLNSLNIYMYTIYDKKVVVIPDENFTKETNSNFIRPTYRRYDGTITFI